MEILAPVGSMDALKAAVQNGANAVYLGGKSFGARASASNFDKDELKDAVKYAHIRDVSVYVTVNTLVKEDEMQAFFDYIKYLYDIDVDALIIQDMGMAKIIKEKLPNFELHASTQMVAHSLNDVLHLQDMGFKRVVLARELNIDEIKYICDNSNVDIEIFVHGALCVCYSGSCYMSSLIGGRSGNRGRCAQPCRKTYELVNDDLEKVNSDGEYILSTRDLNTIKDLGKIIDTGAFSLKIEGRMKRPQYVATVVKAYKDAFDEYIDKKNIHVKDDTMQDLYTIFNREFTDGYILGSNGKDIMNNVAPNNVGLYVGDVIDYNKRAKKLKLKLTATLKKGDGLNIGGGQIGRILMESDIFDIAHAGDVVEIDFINDVKIGQKVYKTLDKELMDRSSRTYENDAENKKVKIDAKISLFEGKNPVLNLMDDRGNSVEITNEKLVEKAMKVPMDDEKIKTSLMKLGNTPYQLGNIEIEKDDGIILPVSVLNVLRRDAVEELNKLRENVNKRKLINSCYDEKVKRRNNTDMKLRVKVKNINQLKQILNIDSIDLIYYGDIKTLDEATELCRENNQKIAFAMPRIIRNENYKLIEDKLKNVDGALVSQIGNINIDKDIHIDYFMNTFNSETIAALENVSSVCMSVELNLHEIKDAAKHTSMDIEALAYGYLPLMVSEYCPMGVLTRDCKKDKRCSECRESKYYLKDERQNKYKIVQDEFCKSYIYDSRAICMMDRLYDMEKSNINVFRLDFTFEENVGDITKAFIDTIENNFDLTNFSSEILDEIKEKGSYKGHYYRGVE